MLTLTTDFGSTEYVAQMKGVIYSVHPRARITDVSHGIRPQNVLQGAYVLAATVPYFPHGTVHIGVVDPGVGGPRRALALRCERGWLVGPDNGLLWPAAEALGSPRAREITDARFTRSQVSSTFHGRDVFAPAAAHLAAHGDDAFDDLGPAVTDPINLRLDEGVVATPKRIAGVVLHVDRFGNIITNIPGAAADALRAAQHWQAVIGTHRQRGDPPATVRRVDTYAEAGPGQLVALMASSGFLELAMNEDSAAARLDVEPGEPVELTPQAA